MAISGNPDLSAQRWSDKARWKKQIVAAVKEAHGNLSAAARSLGITKRTLSRWLIDDPKLAAACRRSKSNGRSNGR